MGERNGVHPALWCIVQALKMWSESRHRPVKGRNHGFEVVLASMKDYHGMFIWLWAPFGSWMCFYSHHSSVVSFCPLPCGYVSRLGLDAWTLVQKLWCHVCTLIIQSPFLPVFAVQDYEAIGYTRTHTVTVSCLSGFEKRGNFAHFPKFQL